MTSIPARRCRSSTRSRPTAAASPSTLFWAEPLGAATSDYDFYLVSSSGNVLDYSPGRPGRQRRPVRADPGHADQSGSGYRLAVVKYAGESRYFRLDLLGGRFMTAADGTPGW